MLCGRRLRGAQGTWKKEEEEENRYKIYGDFLYHPSFHFYTGLPILFFKTAPRLFIACIFSCYSRKA
jgi:hypothetical protein